MRIVRASIAHHTAWGRIESGERRPTLETVFKLARALEVPPAELFSPKSTEPS